MIDKCYEGMANIPAQIIDPCDGNPTSTNCVQSPIANPYLSLPAGATQTQINAALSSALIYKDSQIATINNQPPLQLKTVGGESLIGTGDIPLPSGGGIIEVTYAELTSLIASSTLVVGQAYLLTDYMTTYTQPVTNIAMSSGIVEQLYITAVDINKLHTVCKSKLYPQDIIYYSVTGIINRYYYDDNEVPEPVGTEGFTKGKIYRRIDTYLNNDVGTDWRHVKYRRGSLDLLMFQKYDDSFYTVMDNKMETCELTNSVFYSSVLNNKIGHGFYYNTISSRFDNNIIGLNCKNNAMNAYYNNTIENYFQNNSIADMFRTHIKSYCGVNTLSSITECTIAEQFTNNSGIGSFNGSLSKCKIDYGFFTNTITNIDQSTFGRDARLNTFASGFDSNTIADNFQSNTIGVDFEYNNIGIGFKNNTIGYDFQYNNIGQAFEQNTIDYGFQYNTIGDWFYSNTIGSSFNSNKIEDDFASNNIQNNISYNKYLVSNLPTGLYQNQRFIVTNALNPTYLSVVVGGGTTLTSVMWNNVNNTWIVS